MQVPKYITYILIALLIIGLVCLYFLFENRKNTGEQSSLLLAMAKKLEGIPEKEKRAENKTEYKEKSITDEQQDMIVSIADKLCFDKELSEDENKFYKDFSVEIEKEMENSQKVLSAVINKFLSGSKDFDEYEKEFYEYYPNEIDSIVQYEKLFQSVITKLTTGPTEFSDQELEFQQNYPKEIEKELARIKKESENKKGANPPMAPGQRLKTILEFFNDGFPRTVTDLAKLYAEKTNTGINKGNMSTIFGKLVKDHKLICIKAGPDGKVYHGLPEWFDGKKLKPEFQKNIPK